MKKICIFYFSGTGMTKFVVEGLIGEFEKNRIAVDCFRIEDKHSVVLSEYDVFGIAYPVHSFNAPEIVIDFVKLLPESNGMNTFIVHTAGEDSKLNYASSDLLIRRLRGKGYKVFYNRLIEMPSNFIVRYDDAKVNKIIDNSNKVVPYIAKDIIAQKPYFMKKNIVSKIITFFGKIEWLGARIVGVHFYVGKNSGCVRCGKCIENCPNQNIMMKEKQINFKWRCGICMRCIYHCPQNAINVHQPFKFILLHKWYDTAFNKLK